ncbi:hypothetical protein PPROV_000970700 [Pycnococcus provasolii]|uniref:Suppressor of forked domain-containing protein n=1 Tax=Pycnococcus provasolii TaxID=41880 RepID=A0A830I1F1_9CHLO|nr:hypothetical protein PPROV_000970700 [Pycnococcus provasolii]
MAPTTESSCLTQPIGVFFSPPLESLLLQNPYSLASYLEYIRAARHVSFPCSRHIYLRAVSYLPGSYKLWRILLAEFTAALRSLRHGAPLSVVCSSPSLSSTSHGGASTEGSGLDSVLDPEVEALNSLYERAVTNLPKMPVMWAEYIATLLEQHQIQKARTTLNRALQALPITLHSQVWEPFLTYIHKHADSVPVGTLILAYSRAMQLQPNKVDEYISTLQSRGVYDEAARLLGNVLDKQDSSSLGKSQHDLWLELCNLITSHPTSVGRQALNVDAIFRGGIERFQSDVGRLWTALADYYIRRGLYEQARDVYDEALESVRTVRDFSLVFDALAQFEESVLRAKMEEADGDNNDDDEQRLQSETDAVAAGAPDPLLVRAAKSPSALSDLDLRLARLEHLMARRPLLVSSVRLRQNPNSVPEWLKRVELYEGDIRSQVSTYDEAVSTVVEGAGGKDDGRPVELWVSYAQFHEQRGDVKKARETFERAARSPFKRAEDCATVWCERIEMELRQKCYEDALSLSRRATKAPTPRHVVIGDAMDHDGEENHDVAGAAARSQRLWDLRCDLEESLADSLDDVRAAYDDRLARKLATPQTVLNYALLLWEKTFFEEAFRIYERGVSLFNWPNCVEIWRTYLSKFHERYEGRKMERLRDLYDQCLSSGCPQDLSRAFFVDLARLEEEHGLARRAMDVYDKASSRVKRDERRGIIELYAERARTLFGIDKARDVYQRSVNRELGVDASGVGLPDEDTLALCVRWASLELSLGEVDRTRAIYSHAAQLADPGKATSFWTAWSEFEVRHGDEATFREMLRIKRSVAAAFGPENAIAAAAAAAASGAAATEALPGFVASTQQPIVGNTISGGDFMPSASFAGARPGYVFRTGKSGVGYYLDPTQAKSGGAARPRAPPATKNAEEIDLDLDDDDDDGGGDDDDVQAVLDAAASAKERFKRARVE